MTTSAPADSRSGHATVAGRVDERPAFMVGGNRLRLLTDGPERLEALIALIDGAERNLRLLYYIYADDRSGRRVRDALAAALARGVTVSMVVDGFGSRLPVDYFSGLVQAGADMCHFLPRYGRRYLLRNHQKLVLADERRALIGGFNVEDDYFAETDGWRDLGLCLDGPAAEHIAGYFDALIGWTHRRKARIGDLRRVLARWSEPKDKPVGWLLGGPTRGLSPWALAIRGELKRARRIDIIAGYFTPNPKMLRAVERAPARGGKARVMTAAKSDNTATIAAARHTYARLLRHGVGMFEYRPTKLHTKLFVIDDVVHIGSANFDVRSLYLNLEIMLRIEDQGFADHMRAYVDGELAQADEITAAGHARAGWLDRLRWGVAYFLVAVVDGNLTRRLNFGIDGQ